MREADARMRASPESALRRGKSPPGRRAAALTAGAGRPVTVGGEVAGPGAAAVGEAHRDAARCLDVLFTLDGDGDGASRDELGVYGLVLSQAGRTELDRFVRRTVGPLLDHDAARGSELARTVLTYFGCDGSLARTATALYVHVNTVYQRIDRVTALLGEGWRSGDRALQVHLALKLHLTVG